MKVKQRPDTALSHVGPLPLGRSEEGGERSMHPIQEDMAEFGAQLKHGAIQKAYYALLQYMAGLRTHFQKKWPNLMLAAHLQRLPFAATAGSIAGTHCANSAVRL